MVTNTDKSPSVVLYAILGFLSALIGRGPDRGNLARSVHLAVGVEALSCVKENFIVLSRGVAGVDGTVWPPLSKPYLAYQRRFGKGEKAALKKGAGLTGANRHRGLLTAAQDKRWKEVFYAVYRRLAMSSNDTGAQLKSKAAQIAWMTVKREGAKTMLEVYGNRKVDILRDSGVLLNSLSPGVFDGFQYNKPSAEGGSQQIMEPTDEGAIVGTHVPYAKYHHLGKRPLWPTPFPDVWKARIARVGNQAIAIGCRLAVERAA